jgi:hypothetical protein
MGVPRFLRCFRFLQADHSLLKKTSFQRIETTQRIKQGAKRKRQKEKQAFVDFFFFLFAVCFTSVGLFLSVGGQLFRSRRIRNAAIKLSILPVLIFAAACTEDLSTPVILQTPAITRIEAPAAVYQTPATAQHISVFVDDPQGPGDITNVTLSIKQLATGNAVAQHTMKDDGQNGDILASDGVYFLPFSAALMQNATGDFFLEAQARDQSNNTSEVVRDTMTVMAGAENLPPVLLIAVAPDTVWLDSTYTFQMRAIADDADGVASLLPVLIRIFPPAHPNPSTTDSLLDDGLHDDGLAGDGAFANTFSPALFNKGRGRYEVLFLGRDNAGGLSNALLWRLEVIDRTVNLAPLLSGLQAPTTISLSALQNPYLISVLVIDPNGANDVKQVSYKYFLPDGSEPNPNQFFMNDLGLEGDVTAGDGRYSRTTTVSDTAPLGDYRFEFQAEDRRGLLSKKLIHTITVTN